MLARYRVDNWRSFESLELSLVATKERHFSNRLIKRGYTRLCPVCAIVGKKEEISSYLMSLRFLQLVVTRWDVFKQDFPIYNPNKKPVKIELDIFIDKTPYYYVLECNKHGVIKETLKHRSYLVFDRATSRHSQGLRLQQTLLQELAIKGNKHALNVYNWFKYEFKFVAPDQRLDFFPHWHHTYAVRLETDLMPVFYDLLSNLYPITYIADGYEEMIGESTGYEILKDFLSHCNKDTQTQLILTLNNMELFNHKLFRLDERWVLNSTIRRI